MYAEGCVLYEWNSMKAFVCSMYNSHNELITLVGNENMHFVNIGLNCSTWIIIGGTWANCDTHRWTKILAVSFIWRQ